MVFAALAHTVLITIVLLQTTPKHDLASRVLRTYLHAMTPTASSLHIEVKTAPSLDEYDFLASHMSKSATNHAASGYIVIDPVGKIRRCEHVVKEHVRRLATNQNHRRHRPFGSSPEAFWHCRASPTSTAAAHRNKKTNNRNNHNSSSSSITSGDNKIVYLGGMSEIAILHSAWSLLEGLGARFYTTRDQLPPTRSAIQLYRDLFHSTPRKQQQRAAMSTFSAVDKADQPIFIKARGPLPFADFFEGVDLWSADGYKTVFTQSSKMRHTMFAMHTYPVNNAVEPLVWVGLKKDLNSDGTVTRGYYAWWQHSGEVNDWWSPIPMNTSQYHLGAGQLFNDDCYSPSMSCSKFWPQAKNSSEVFDAAGPFINASFFFARKNFGIKTCVGTEMPLATDTTYLNAYCMFNSNGSTAVDCTSAEFAPNSSYRMVYQAQGEIRRLPAVGGPKDVHLVYWQRGNDKWLAPDSATPPAPGFTRTYINNARPGHHDQFNGFFALAGSPTSPSSCPAGSLPLDVYYNNKTDDHWSIANDDLAQLAVTTMGFDKLMNNPWGVCVTIFDIKTTPLPTTRDYYEGIFAWIHANYPIDEYWLWSPEIQQWGAPNTTDPLAFSMLDEILTARDVVRSNNYSVTIGTSGWSLGPIDNNDTDGTAFWAHHTPDDVTINSMINWIGMDPVNPAYGNIKHHNSTVIAWAEDDTAVDGGAELWVGRTLAQAKQAHEYGATGFMSQFWRLFEITATIHAMNLASWETTMHYNTFDVYLDFSLSSFGELFAEEAARMFTKLDSFQNDTFGLPPKLPRDGLSCCTRIVPITGTTNPQNLTFGKLMQQYDFALEWKAWADQVAESTGWPDGVGATREQARNARYWADMFMYHRGTAAVSWRAYEIQLAMQQVLASSDPMYTALSVFTPAAYNFSVAFTEMQSWLFRYMHTTGEQGMIMSNEQLNIGYLFGDAAFTVANATNFSYSVPRDCLVSNSMPTSFNFTTLFPLWIRTFVDSSIEPNFVLEIDTYNLAKGARVNFFWQLIDYHRSAAGAAPNKVALRRFRGTFHLSMPTPSADFQWYVAVDQRRDLRFPPDEGKWQSVTVV